MEKRIKGITGSIEVDRRFSPTPIAHVSIYNGTGNSFWVVPQGENVERLATYFSETVVGRIHTLTENRARLTITRHETFFAVDCRDVEIARAGFPVSFSVEQATQIAQALRGQ